MGRSQVAHTKAEFLENIGGIDLHNLWEINDNAKIIFQGREINMSANINDIRTIGNVVISPNV
jgi:hypothetical protein